MFSSVMFLKTFGVNTNGKNDERADAMRTIQDNSSDRSVYERRKKKYDDLIRMIRRKKQKNQQSDVLTNCYLKKKLRTT